MESVDQSPKIVVLLTVYFGIFSHNVSIYNKMKACEFCKTKIQNCLDSKDQSIGIGGGGGKGTCCSPAKTT